MNQIKLWAIASIAIPAIGYAAPPMVAGHDESCAAIKWNAAFLSEYPTAPAACREVKEQDGVRFATFNGEVSKVGHDFVQVAVFDAYNNPISKIAFQIGTGGRITVGKKIEDVKDLEVGDRLTFWVREGEYGISPNLKDHPMAIIKPEAMAAN